MFAATYCVKLVHFKVTIMSYSTSAVVSDCAAAKQDKMPSDFFFFTCKMIGWAINDNKLILHHLLTLEFKLIFERKCIDIAANC